MNCPRCGGATRVQGTADLLEGAFVRRRRLCKRAGCWLRFSTREEPEPNQEYVVSRLDELADAVPGGEGAAPGTCLRVVLDRALPTAGRCDGYFTTQDAQADGCGAARLHRLVQRGAVVRLARHTYRLAHLPPSRHERTILAWLWSRRVGVACGRTALELLDLVEPIPGAPVELLVLAGWRARLRRVPEGVVLRRVDELPALAEGTGVPTTQAARAIVDALAVGADEAELRAAVRAALQRGLLDRAELRQEGERARVDVRAVMLRGIALQVARPLAFETALPSAASTGDQRA